MSRHVAVRARRLAARIFTYEELVEAWSDAMGRGDYRDALLWCDVMDEQTNGENK